MDTQTGGVFAALGSSVENADSGCLLAQDCELFSSEQLKAGGSAGVAVDSSGVRPLTGTVYAANTVADQVQAAQRRAGSVHVARERSHGDHGGLQRRSEPGRL